MSAGARPPVGTPAEAPPRRRAHGARTMFSVPFASTMNDGDIAYLAKTLNLTTHLHPKLHHSPTSPGVVRLDFDSGLFLVRGANKGEWALEGRTLGDPLPQAVDEWHLSATVAARQLDPTVVLPGKS